MTARPRTSPTTLFNLTGSRFEDPSIKKDTKNADRSGGTALDVSVPTLATKWRFIHPTGLGGEGRPRFLTMFMKMQTLFNVRQIFVSGKRLTAKALFSGRGAAGEESGNKNRRIVSRCY
jgi:hypothetical protein